MNKKFLFIAAVAAAGLSACSSEDALLEEVATKPAGVAEAEIIGAKLASAGISIAVDNGEVDTRAAGWKSTDKIGLAWVNNKNGGAITDPQGTKLQSDFTGDNNVYANIILTTADGGSNFSTSANVYEGAYFVYSPWAYIKGAGELSFKPNAQVQKAGLNEERLSTLPWVSGLQFIKADENIQKGEFAKSFKISPIANAVRVTTTADKKIVDALKTIEGANFGSVKLGSDQAQFSDEITINVDELARYTTAGAPKDEAMDEAAKNMNKSTAKKTIETKVDAKYGAVAESNEFRVFVAPVVELAYGVQTKPTVTVAVYNADQSTKIGEFAVKTSTKETAANQAAIKKLAEALECESALYSKSLAAILRNNKGVPAALGLNIDLTADNFKMTIADNINNLSDWDAAVKLYDALGKDAPATFTIKGDVEFEGEIAVPAKGVTVKAKGGNLVLKSGKATLPATMKGDNTDYPHFIVKEGAELVIAHETQNSETTMVFGTEAKGKITLAKGANNVNLENGNAGVVEIEQDAATKDAAPAINNNAGEIVYLVNKTDLKDDGTIAKVKAVSFATAVKVAGKTLETTETLAAVILEAGTVKAENVGVVTAASGVSAITSKNVTAASIALAEGATLNVTIGEGETAGALSVTPGGVTGKGKLDIAGKGTATAATGKEATVDLHVNPGVTSSI